MSDIRNVAIIAHVDHGKTTLIDSILGQSGQFRENQAVAERAMDSNTLEKERGITILAKCTAINWNGTTINIVDTPGHADFGGEVERILGMVDGAIILVDAAEGPLPQTKFVLKKALTLGLKPIVVVNKVDRSDARVKEVLNEIYELFIALDANDEQIDFKVLYASGRDGWASFEEDKKGENLSPLLDTILEIVPIANNASKNEDPFTMLATILESDPFLGRMLTGKVVSGVAKVNATIKAIDLNGKLIEQGRISKILQFQGLKRIPIEEAETGNIIVLAGMKTASVTHTLCAMENNTPVKSYPIDPPTISINFSVNDSPFAGQEGKKSTSRMIGERLEQEMDQNIAIQVTQSETKESFQVAGRGELQLGILIETMRREGFEMTISRPKVLMKKDANGKLLEPIEEVHVDVDEEFTGAIIEQLALRKGMMVDMVPNGANRQKIIFNIPTRGLIGYHSQFLTSTRGTGIMNRLFKDYEEYKGPISGRLNGVLISNDKGEATAYSLFNLEDRGKMFIKPGEKVYEGMIIGEHSRDNDLEVNIIRAKQLTNIRASGKDDAIKCTTPITFSLEEAIAYIQDDELLEVTPENIRLRKKYLIPHERKKAARTNEEFELLSK